MCTSLGSCSRVKWTCWLSRTNFPLNFFIIAILTLGLIFHIFNKSFHLWLPLWWNHILIIYKALVILDIFSIIGYIFFILSNLRVIITTFPNSSKSETWDRMGEFIILFIFRRYCWLESIWEISVHKMMEYFIIEYKIATKISIIYFYNVN